MTFRTLATSAALALTLLFAPAAFAASTHCPDNFFDGKAPDLVNPKLATRATALCYDEFAVLYSGLTRTPLYSADHLIDVNVDEARKLHRSDATQTFHPELGVPEADRSELSDYRGSGYDRGHMSPNGDFDTPAAQGSSFTLANCIPQAPRDNRGIWEAIEETTRNLAEQYGEVYIVTLFIFVGDKTLWLQNRVAIPAKIAKKSA